MDEFRAPDELGQADIVLLGVLSTSAAWLYHDSDGQTIPWEAFLGSKRLENMHRL